jgi:hypothetical protein
MLLVHTVKSSRLVAKAVSQHTYEGVRRKGCIAPTNLQPRNFIGVSDQRHVPFVIYPREKNYRYPLYRRLGGPQSRSGHRGQRKNPLTSAWNRTPVVQSVARQYTDRATLAPCR